MLGDSIMDILQGDGRGLEGFVLASSILGTVCESPSHVGDETKDSGDFATGEGGGEQRKKKRLTVDIIT
jgi:hypothetical protein